MPKHRHHRNKNNAGKFAAPNLRWQIRHPADALCHLATSRFRIAVRLADASASGTRIECRSGLLPHPFEPVRLTWPDGSASLGRITWIGEKHLGIEFVDLVPDIPDRCDSASLGSASYVELIRLQKAAARQRGTMPSHPKSDFCV